MVKVKGQISDIALCITDDDPRISGELVFGIMAWGLNLCACQVRSLWKVHAEIVIHEKGMFGFLDL